VSYIVEQDVELLVQNASFGTDDELLITHKVFDGFCFEQLTGFPGYCHKS
jgi:hypothetical protein